MCLLLGGLSGSGACCRSLVVRAARVDWWERTLVCFDVAISRTIHDSKDDRRNGGEQKKRLGNLQTILAIASLLVVVSGALWQVRSRLIDLSIW